MLDWLKKKPIPERPAAAKRDASEQWRAKGNACLDENRLKEAEDCYLQAVAADPDNALAFLNLGYAQWELQKAQDARGALEKAASLQPMLGDAHYLLGTIACQTGETALGISCYERALMVQADFPECRRDLCLALARAGRTREARSYLEAGNAFPPGSVEYHFFNGTLHLADNELADAIRHFRMVVQQDPVNLGALNNLGLTLFNQGDVFSAIDSYERVLKLQPDDVLAHCNLGGAYQIRSKLDLAAQHYRKAIELDPAYTPAYNNLLYGLSFDPRCPPLSYLEEAGKFAEHISRRAKPYAQWLCPPRTEGSRPLRVGLVSGDLNNHAVGAFLEGVLARMDPAKLTLVAYATRSKEDSLTARIKPRFAQWNMVEALSDESLAARIHADQVDILLDLAGHTAHNRLPVFAWRAAPVQVAWLGYWASTGVTEIDAILVDPVAVPEAEKHHLSEPAWYLPDTRLCFSPPVTSRPMEVSSPPSKSRACITFGSFQIFSKLSDGTLAAWARVLAAVPGSRLRLQSWQLGFPDARADLLQRLAQLGVASERVALHGGSSRDEYLAAYSEVDIILDTFPFPGGTTTVEALWMGVPTVTLAGSTLLGRQGESLMCCAGLGDWVAKTESGYVELAVAKAQAPEALAALRASLRTRVLASPLFDAERFARHLEAALEGIWRAKLGG